MKNKLILISAISLLLSIRGFSQNVENVDFNLAGEKINIFYDLNNIQKCDVDIKFITEDGQTIIPRTITGDVGKGIAGGKNKKAVWNVFEDRGGLSGNHQCIINISNVRKFTNNDISLFTQIPVEVKYSFSIGGKYVHYFSKFGGYVSLAFLEFSDEDSYNEDCINYYDGFSLYAGGAVNLNAVKPYIGAGLCRQLYDYCADDEVAYGGDIADIGPCFQGGFMIPVKRFLIDAGANLFPAETDFYLSFTVGIGYSF